MIGSAACSDPLCTVAATTWRPSKELTDLQTFDWTIFSAAGQEAVCLVCAIRSCRVSAHHVSRSNKTILAEAEEAPHSSVGVAALDILETSVERGLLVLEAPCSSKLDVDSEHHGYVVVKLVRLASLSSRIACIYASIVPYQLRHASSDKERIPRSACCLQRMHIQA